MVIILKPNWILIRSKVVRQFLLVCPEGKILLKEVLVFIGFLYLELQVFFYIQPSKGRDDGL